MAASGKTGRLRRKANEKPYGVQKHGMWALGWQRFKRNKTGILGLVLVCVVVLAALFGPFLAPYDPNDQSAMLEFRSKSPPSWKNPLGTDRMGYDVFSRVIYGAPTALVVGIGSMLVASSSESFWAGSAVTSAACPTSCSCADRVLPGDSGVHRDSGHRADFRRRGHRHIGKNSFLNLHDHRDSGFLAGLPSPESPGPNSCA